MQRIAASQGDRTSRQWTSAESLVLFPEVEELCLGYTYFGTQGLGSGREFARLIVEGIWTDISQGIKNIRHFEHLQLFQEGIGRDRISDATAGILRQRIANYTQSIALERDLPVRQKIYPRAKFDGQKGRWVAGSFNLPVNPYTDRPVLLVPKQFLRPLPTINANDFWDYVFDNENELLRDRFGEDIGRSVNKKDIIDLATANPEARAQYEDYREGTPGRPYDMYTDRKGLVRWYDATRDWVSNNPRKLNFHDDGSFESFARALISEFQNYIENDGGWHLLWNDDGSSRSEEACQKVFLGIVKHYCKANEVDISAEANIGRGPVDFKVSSGYQNRALIELKLARNTKWWRGLERQLPAYLQAEDIAFGAFVVIAFTDKDNERVLNIQVRTREMNESTQYTLMSTVVDARKPASGSML